MRPVHVFEICIFERLYADAKTVDGRVTQAVQIILAQVQRLNEYIMTSLRTMWGCDLNKIEQDYGADIANEVEKGSHLFQEKKWITQKEKTLLLTNAGKLFADRIAGEMFLEER